MIIIRNDDVSMASDFVNIKDCYSLIKERIRDAEIWTSVTIFSKDNKGSVYPDIPLINKKFESFFDVNGAWDNKFNLGKIVSHGLFHVDHTLLSDDALQMSILGSCKYLNTDIFIPPFGKVNHRMAILCATNNIKLENDDWKSLEKENFSSSHNKWYFHSWRLTANDMETML